MENTSSINYTLITGSTAGIGKQIAIECAKKGLNLYLVSLPETGIEEFAELLKAEYSIDVKFLAIDLTKYEAPARVYEYAVGNGIEVNILINNAGIGFKGKFETLTTAITDEMILLNVRATTLLTLLFLPAMQKMPKAHILNMSSFAAFAPVPYKCVYSATKTYLFFLTRALNSELKHTNIKVTSIHPTGVDTKRNIESNRKSSFISRISVLSPEEVAEIAVKNMLNGNKFVIPGLMSKAYYYLGSMLPHGLILWLTGNVFKKSR